MPVNDTGRAGLRWHPLALEPRVAGEAALQSPQLRVLSDAGVPLADGARSPRDHALLLLQTAAEVEHALMVQYLYLAMSVADEAVQQEIVQIAIEEMAHLGTVQNLLLLIGGPAALHLQRDLVRLDSEHNALPLVLEPLDRVSLAKYAVVEAPETPPPELRAKVAELQAIARESAGVSPNRVGAIYAMLEWLFSDAGPAQALVDLKSLLPPGSLPAQPHLTDADLQAEAVVAAHEMLPDEWGDDNEAYLLETVRTRAQAVLAIRRVGAQGEGAEAGADSHFLRFMTLVERFEAGAIATLALPRSPMIDGNGGEQPTPLRREHTIKWARVFNLQYSLIVLGIHHAVRLPRSDAEQAELRQDLAELTMVAMRTALLAVATLIMTLPVADGEPALAGPPFELNPDHLPSDLAALPAIQLQLLNEAEGLYQAIETDPVFAANGDEALRLRGLRRLDRKRRNLFASA